MAEKYVKFLFDVDSPPPLDLIIETFCCPKCKMVFPVKEEYIDYRILYEETKEYFKKQDSCFRTFISEMEKEIPEVKIYLHNNKQDLINKLKELQKLYKDGQP